MEKGVFCLEKNSEFFVIVTFNIMLVIVSQNKPGSKNIRLLIVSLFNTPNTQWTRVSYLITLSVENVLYNYRFHEF